jgi:hypothetical protein
MDVQMILGSMLEEQNWGNMSWIQLAQDRDYW